MIEQLFGSKTRVKLLQLFYANPNRAFYVREITRKIDEQINSVRRELANLLSIGIISSEDNAHKLYYEVDQNYDFYKPLSEIFGGKKKAVAVKTVSASGDGDNDKLKSIGNIEIAFLTGQFTRDETASIDLLIVGDVNHTKLEKYISDLEKTEGKEIRYSVMTKKDFDYRQQVKDRFITNVLQNKRQVLIDKHKVLNEL
jgi:hypothetical protein